MSGIPVGLLLKATLANPLISFAFLTGITICGCALLFWWPGLLPLPAEMRLGLLLGSPIIAAVASLPLVFVFNEWLSLQGWQVLRALEGIEADFADASSNRKQILLLRALRFHCMLPAQSQSSGEMAVARMLARVLPDAQVGFAGWLLRQAAAGNELVRAALRETLARMNATLREAILQAALSDSPSFTNSSNCCGLLMDLAAHQVFAARRSGAGNGSETLCEGGPPPHNTATVPYIPTAPIPRHELARVLLLLTTARIRALRGLVTWTWREECAACVRSICPQELLIWLSLRLPQLVGLGFLFGAFALATGAYILWLALVGRSWDPLDVSRFARRPVRELREAVLHSIQFYASGDRTHAPVRTRRLLTALIAHTLAEGTDGGHSALERWPLPTLRYAIPLLFHRGWFRSPGDVVLSSMADRNLLQLTVSLRPQATRSSRPSICSTTAAEDQVARLLPVVPKTRHFVWSASLGLIGATFWGAAAWLASTTSSAPPLPFSALLATLFCCLFLTIWQHLWSPQASSIRSFGGFDDTGSQLFGCLGILLIAMVFLWGELIVAGIPRAFIGFSKLISKFIWLFPIPEVMACLLAGLVVPEVITRWRGANLLFPTQWQIWRQRLLLVPAFVVSCLLLGWLQATVARLATLAR